MAILGNLFLILATISFLVLQSPSFRRPPPGGDAGVGYAWGIIIFNLAFAICMLVVTLSIGAKGGFEWVSPKRSTRMLFVTIGVLTTLITCALSSLFRHEPGAPALLRSFSGFIPVVVPVIMIIGGAILLNAPLRNAVPVALYKWPLIIVSLIGVTGTASALVGWMVSSARNQAATIREGQAAMDSNHQRMLNEIDTCDVTKNMVFILVMTGDNQERDIQERAVAKVKTHPQWQQELIRLLQTGWASEPFQFLASNEVDDPSLFLEPVRLGVLKQAELFRQRIRDCNHPSNFYPGMFDWDTERVLRTVNRFKGKGVDYVPAVKELRAALDEPSPYEKPKFGAVKMLDKWIKEN